MYIKADTIENISESLIKRENEEMDITENSIKMVATRLSTIVVILSWYIYGKYALLCLKGLIKHKNLNFLFPLTATLFAFVNNTNDIANYIYHQSNCYPFYVIFVGSATLNWAPISWLQAYRLALISKIYLSKLTFFIIVLLAIILSSLYCSFYFLNLSLFDYEKTEVLGCAVTNPGTWTSFVMISDIADSVFFLASICIIIYKSINHLKEMMSTRNEKLNNLVGQGIIELFIIAIAKIVIYPIIKLTSFIPGLDVFWDVLSIIVIICAYNLVNFPYENSDDLKNRHILRKAIFDFIDTSVSHSSGSTSTSTNGASIRYLKSQDTENVKSDIFSQNYRKISFANGNTSNYNRNINQNYIV